MFVSSILKLLKYQLLFYHHVTYSAVECPPAPYFQPDTPEGETTWDPDVDQPLYAEIATYTCPEGFVFEIYQDFPNISINFGLIEDETDTVNLTCAAFADWSPSEVPPCIRMYFSDTSSLTIFCT